jgi:predicted ribosomally synthesized peptide with SipW-like signal peptide
MKKIVLSVATIALVAAVAIGATTAYFSDTETSTGNTFSAGAIDLKIDNESYYNGEPSEGTSWELSDLTDEVFFNFQDLKPGDYGEDTISVHVDSNDAWACANITLTGAPDNGIVEPESEAGDQTDGDWEGELDDELNFIFWADDGDNVLEEREEVLLSGKASDLPQGDDNSGATYTLADSNYNAFNQQGPLTGGQTYYIGKVWCFGELDITPLTQDDYDPETADNVSCDGAPVTNLSQTDSVIGDISFTAVQSRNNDNFTCQPERD